MQDERDEQFDAAFAEAVKNHDFTPNFEQSWQRMEKRLARRRRNRTRLRMLPYAAVSFLLGALLFGSPSASKAFDPFFQTVKSLPHGVVNVFYGSNERDENAVKAKTAPPPGYEPAPDSGGSGAPLGVSTQAEFASAEEAAEKADFKLPRMGYTPEGFKVDQILGAFMPGSSKASSVAWIYTKGDDGRYTIQFQHLSGNSKMSTDYREEDGKLEIVRLHGVDAYLFETKDGYTSLEYLQGSIYTSIVGNLSKEQILKVAENIG